MAKAPKRYNTPAQITEEDRRKAREEVARAERERTSDSDIPESDKMTLEEMIRKDDFKRRNSAIYNEELARLNRESMTSSRDIPQSPVRRPGQAPGRLVRKSTQDRVQESMEEVKRELPLVGESVERQLFEAEAAAQSKYRDPNPPNPVDPKRNDMPLKKGGFVRKYAEGGLVRGGGIALRGVGKGTVY